MGRPTGAGLVRVATGLACLASPALAHAHGPGLGTAAAGLLLGVPLGLLLVVLGGVSLVLGRAGAPAGEGRRRFGRVARRLSLVLPACFVLLLGSVALLELRASGGTTAVRGAVGFLLVFGVPVLALGALSGWLGHRLARRGARSQ